MVHHLGAGFSKETFYWLLQHKGRSQILYVYIYIINKALFGPPDAK